MLFITLHTYSQGDIKDILIDIDTVYECRPAKKGTDIFFKHTTRVSRVIETPFEIINKIRR